MATDIAMRQLQRKLVIGMIYDFVEEMSPKMLKSGVAVGFIAGFAPMFWYHKHDKKRTQEEANQKSYESVAEELKFIKSVADELKLFTEKYELKSMNSGNNKPSNNSLHSPEASKDDNNNNSSYSYEPSKSSSNTSNSMSLNSEPLRNSSNSNAAYPEPLKNNSSSSISSYPEPSNNNNSPSILYKWIFG